MAIIKKATKKERVNKATSVKAGEVKVTGNVKLSRIIVRPLVTEKSAIAQSLNKYSFIVSKFATKTEIKKAVNEVYGVMPSGVNVSMVDGKIKQSGRHSGRRSDYKKAVVSLPKGETITIHEGV